MTNTNFPSPEDYKANRDNFVNGSQSFRDFNATEPMQKTDDKLKQQAERESKEFYAANRLDILSGKMKAQTASEIHEQLIQDQADTVEQKRQSFRDLLHKNARTTGDDQHTEKLNQLSQTLDENIGDESMTNRIMAQARSIGVQRTKGE